MSVEHRRIAVIGSGPAGYTAALYAARAELKPVVFEGVAGGGSLMTTTEVENYPGFPSAIQGPQLMANIREQAERFEAELLPEDVIDVDLLGPLKRLRTVDTQWTADAVILAMGSAYRRLNIPGEEALSGRGVSWCATCDGFFYRGQDVAVVGGGDTAMEEALFLTRFADSVTVVHRRAELRASKIMAERALANPKIRWAWSSEVHQIHGSDKLAGLGLRDTRTGATAMLEVQGVFIAVGHDPRSDLVKGQVELDSNGYIVTQGRSSRTNLPGVFAAGDVVDHDYRQAVTAAGMGCQAALDAERYLAAQGN